jgi:hypothetical protein
MDTVGIRVPTTEFSTFKVSSALKHSPSAICITDVNYICRFLDFSAKTKSPLRTLARHQGVFRLHAFSLVLFSFVFLQFIHLCSPVICSLLFTNRLY